MLASDTPPRPLPTWPWWRWVVTGGSALGLALSGYLSWLHLTQGSAPGCGGRSSCDQLLSSRWSTLGGVLPVSGLAASLYLAMLVDSFFIGPATPAPTRRLAWSSMLVLVGAAAGSAVWFIILQAWVMQALCTYCLAIHVTSLLLAVVVIWHARLQNYDDAPSAQLNVSITRRPLGLALFGVTLACIFAVVQLIGTPADNSHGGVTSAESQAIDTHSVPLIGPPDAHYVVTLMLDYQCAHCQQLHLLLEEAIRHYDGQLAFALSPVPLSRKCNPFIVRDVDEFKDSCELARLSLAVWLANRAAFADFEDWMFSFESGDRWQPRSLEAAQAQAVELVGRVPLEAALADPWIDQYLQTSIQTYGKTGSRAVPVLIFGSRWIIPEVHDTAGLVSILQDGLAVPEP